MTKTFRLMLMALALVLGIPAGALAQDETLTYTFGDGEYTQSYGGDYANCYKKWTSSDGLVTITAQSNYDFLYYNNYRYLYADTYVIEAANGYVVDSYSFQAKAYWGDMSVTYGDGQTLDLPVSAEDYKTFGVTDINQRKVSFQLTASGNFAMYPDPTASTIVIKKGEEETGVGTILTYGLADGTLCGNENNGYYSAWQSNDGKLLLSYENGTLGFLEYQGYYYLFPGKVKVRAAKGHLVSDYSFWATPYTAPVTITTDDGGEFVSTPALEEGEQAVTARVNGKGDGSRITFFTITSDGGSLNVNGSSSNNPFNIVVSDDAKAQEDDPDGEGIIWGGGGEVTNGVYGLTNGTFSDQRGQYYKTWESEDGKLKIQSTTAIFQPKEDGTLYIKPGKMVVTAAKGYQIDEYMMYLYVYYANVKLVTSDGLESELSSALSEDGSYVAHQVMGSPGVRRVIMEFTPETASAVMGSNTSSNYFYFALSENDDPEIDNVPDPDTDLEGVYTLEDGDFKTVVRTSGNFTYTKTWVSNDGILTIDATESPEDTHDFAISSKTSYMYFYPRTFTISVPEGYEIESYQLNSPYNTSNYDITLTAEDGQTETIPAGTKESPAENFVVNNVNAQSTTLTVSNDENKGNFCVHKQYNQFIVKSTTTGIRITEATQQAARPGIFDLQGRQVQNPQKGIYIVDGKKVIIK